MDDLVKDFLAEANESLSTIDRDIVLLESNPSDKDVLNRVFRAIHSIKGTCGMFALARMEKVAHAAEDVLGRMREGALVIQASTITPVLKAIDAIKALLEHFAIHGAEPVGDDTAVVQALRSLLGTNTTDASASPAVSTATPGPVAATPASAPAAAPASVAAPAQPVADQSLRVNVELLDGLMNLVGELVLTRNQLVQLVKGLDDSDFMAPIQQLNRVTSGLQEAVMKTRMQPIGNAWSKLTRVVRDLSVTLGKEVQLSMTGAETEVDRQILQAVQDPLTHCVRNAVDHGIESSEARLKSGKRPAGTISLEAFHEGGHIIIDIKDDGGGINVDAVRAKAIERGIVREDVARELTDAQVMRFIFEPGFSTAKHVTEVSGRGVGMDVVRSNIEGIGGSVDVASQSGQGTTIRIKIPLTLAIISALIVNVGGEFFALPQVGVLELVRVSENNQHLIETIHGSRVFRLRDRLLPLIGLGEILNIKSAPAEFAVVVCQVGDNQFGLVVDEISDMQEVVVKPVGRLIRGANLFAGTTILGDGRVIIILDAARVVAKALQGDVSAAMAHDDDNGVVGDSGEKTTVLLFRAGSETPMAVPLALVARLEEFQRSKIETVDSRHVVQYRGGLLPLIFCRQGMTLDQFEDRAIPCIIFSDSKRSMGLVVSEIDDIVEENINIESSGKHSGVLGAAVLEGRATEVIDTYHYLQLAYPDWFDKKKKLQGRGRVLLVEDSGFFRDLIRPVLESHGYQVTVACDGAEGIEELKKDRFDAILSDIEMPVMNGLEFAAQVTANAEWSKLPLMAITSLDSPEDHRRALEAGFHDYLVKFDQDILLSALHRALSKPNASTEKSA